MNDNQISVELGKIIQNKSFIPDELNSYLSNNKNESLYLYLTISSLSYHGHNLYSLINNFKAKPKITGISECRITKNKAPLCITELKNYLHEQTPTEASKGVALFYISEELNYKAHKDL